MSYLKSLLGERETVEHMAHQHISLLLRDILPELTLTILSAILVTQLVTLTGRLEVAIGYLLVLIPFAMVLREWLIWYNHQYVVTSHRVIQMFGVFNKNVTDSSLEKVNDVKLEQSFWGRLLGYGDIQILTASEMGINRFTMIGRPVRFKTEMLNAKQKLESAVGEARLPGASVAGLLAHLDALRASGVIDEKEYQAKKDALGAKV